jgi:hypothetical protein
LGAPAGVVPDADVTSSGESPTGVTPSGVEVLLRENTLLA